MPDSETMNLQLEQILVQHIWNSHGPFRHSHVQPIQNDVWDLCAVMLVGSANTHCLLPSCPYGRMPRLELKPPFRQIQRLINFHLCWHGNCDRTHTNITPFHANGVYSCHGPSDHTVTSHWALNSAKWQKKKPRTEKIFERIRGDWQYRCLLINYSSHIKIKIIL